MVDLFHVVSDCANLIGYWDVARRDDAVLLRARSRVRYPTEHAASQAAHVIAARLQPCGYDVRATTAGVRPDGDAQVGWHAFVEILVA